MKIFNTTLINLRSNAIQYIHEYIKENGNQELEDYSVFMNTGLKIVAVSPKPYIMNDAATRLSTELDTDTLCEIADELIRLKLKK